MDTFTIHSMNGIQNSRNFNAASAELGGKASGLLFLEKIGFQVPPFFLLTPETTIALLKGNILAEALVDEWVQQNNIDSDSIWAVRSSAGVEDGQALSYAGLFHTEINIRPSAIPGALHKVLEGCLAVPGLLYGSEKAFPFTIVLQQMLRPEYSGVVFSHNPLDVSDNSTWVNIIPGLGIHLVSGREEAFSCRFSAGAWTFPNSTEQFNGQIFSTQLEDVNQSGSEVKTAIKQFLPELLKGVGMLVSLKNHPVDVEFAISGGQLYWLQLRPITTPKRLATVRVWDNANIGDNYPGMSLPLSISFTRHTYERAYTGMARFLGMTEERLVQNKTLFANMMGGVHGAMYYNITAWQQLLYQLPFGKRTSKHIARLLGMEDATFQKPASRSSVWQYLLLFYNLISALLLFRKHKTAFEALYAEVLGNYRQMDLSGKSHSELIRIYEDLEERLAAKWIVPVLNGFYAMLFFASLKWLFQRSRLKNTHPNFINDILYAQGDVISVQIVRDYRKLQKKVQTDAGLRSWFTSHTPDEVLSELPTQFPEFWNEFNQYVYHFGCRCEQGELKMETVDYREDPRKLIAMLQAGAFQENTPIVEVASFSYQKVLEQAYSGSPIKRRMLLFWIKNTLGRIRDRENYRFLRTDGFALVRRIFRAMDATLLHAGYLDCSGDSLYLELEQLTTPGLADSYRAIAVKNKQWYQKHAQADRAPRYLEDEEGRLEPVFPEKVVQGSALRGMGCCSGTVTATVGLVTEENAGKADFSGRILVARYFEPGWVNLFANAAGVISERGNLLSHTAILCREMGVPAIVGCKGISNLVEDGDQIRMNGATGEVEILSKC